MAKTFSRLEKATDAETILYEIDMLRFAASELVGGKLERGDREWVYLECFLLHYRNLIEFVGKEQREVRKTDLHVSNIWKRIRTRSPAELAQIHAVGRKLWEKYERVDDRISRFLQHCTTLRTEFKEWEVGTMYNELEPLLYGIESAIRPARAQQQRLTILDREANSTATWVRYGPLIDGAELNALIARVKPTK
jgi:hypothetical protein